MLLIRMCGRERDAYVARCLDQLHIQAMIAGYRTDQQIRMGKNRRVYAFILYPSQATQLSSQSHITTPIIGRLFYYHSSVQPNNLVVHIVNPIRATRRNFHTSRRSHNHIPTRIEQLKHLQPRLHTSRRAIVESRVHAHRLQHNTIACRTDLHPR